MTSIATHPIRRTRRAACLGAALAAMSLHCPALAQSIFSPAEQEVLKQRLEAAGATAVLGAYQPLLEREGIDPASVRRGDYALVACLIERAIARGLNIVQFTADPVFGRVDLVLGLERAVLEQVSSSYGLHSLFKVSARSVAGAPVLLQALVLGRSHMILVYDPPGWVHNAEYRRGFGNTGNYHYAPYIAMELSPKGTGSLLQLTTLASPSADESQGIGVELRFLPDDRVLGIESQGHQLDVALGWAPAQQIPIAPIARRAGATPASGCWDAPRPENPTE